MIGGVNARGKKQNPGKKADEHIETRLQGSRHPGQQRSPLTIYLLKIRLGATGWPEIAAIGVYLQTLSTRK